MHVQNLNLNYQSVITVTALHYLRVTTAEKLCKKPLGYALELVKKAKNKINEEYMQSLADMLVIRGRPHFTVVRTFLMSDLTHVGFIEVGFGWANQFMVGQPKVGSGLYLV